MHIHTHTHTSLPSTKFAFLSMEAQKPFHLSLLHWMFQLPRQHLHITSLDPEWFASFTTLIFSSRHSPQSTDMHVRSYSKVPAMSQSPNPYLDLIKSWLSWTKLLGKREREENTALRTKGPSENLLISLKQPHTHILTHMNAKCKTTMVKSLDSKDWWSVLYVGLSSHTVFAHDGGERVGDMHSVYIWNHI